MEIGSNNALNKCPNSAGRRGPYLIFYAVAALVLMASVSFIHEYNVFVIKRGA